MAVFREYAEHDGVGLADLVRRREVSPSDLLESAFDLIDRLNPRLNAIVAPMRERAEADVKAGLPEGPFTGVPFALKDGTLSCAGFPTSSGSRVWQGFTRAYDSELTLRYKKAGLVIGA